MQSKLRWLFSDSRIVFACVCVCAFIFVYISVFVYSLLAVCACKPKKREREEKSCQKILRLQTEHKQMQNAKMRNRKWKNILKLLKNYASKLSVKITVTDNFFDTINLRIKSEEDLNEQWRNLCSGQLTKTNFIIILV